MSDSSQPVAAIPAELLPYVAVAELIVQTFGQASYTTYGRQKSPFAMWPTGM